MELEVWGARGSLPAPGPQTARYGGNTSCVQLTLSDGSTLILDAGTGIRQLGLSLPADLDAPIHILLTHLHLDHIQGLMFFAPAFRPGQEIVVWGPAAPEAPLVDRIGRYLSAPLSPIEVRELPSCLAFRECEGVEWTIGSATIQAASVTHRGATLGYRITDGGQSVVYLPDHEPALGTPLDELEDEWVSGLALARDASLLVHDCQYSDDEYPHHLGWGHSSVSDALTFAARARAEQLLLFHHDPMHSDAFLDDLAADAAARWTALGGRPGSVSLAAEHARIALPGGALA